MTNNDYKKEVTYDFAYIIVENHEDAHESVGEWCFTEGKITSLYERGDDPEDDREFDEQYDDWTWTYEFMWRAECGNDNCDRYDCGRVQCGVITIKDEKGKEYRYNYHQDYGIEPYSLFSGFFPE